MKTSELYYESALECVQDGIAITDKQGKIIYSNSALAKLYEYSSIELSAQLIFPLLITANDWETIINQLKSGEKSETLITLIKKNANTESVRIISAQIVDAQSDCQTIFHSFQRSRSFDKKLPSEELLQKIFYNSVDAAFITSPETRKITNCNKAAAQILGAEHRTELIGKELLDFFKEGLDSGNKHAIDISLKDKGEWNAEIILKSLSGREFWAHISLKRITTEDIDILFTLIRDIHERKTFEEQLLLQKAKVEDANQKLILSEEKYRLIVESAADIIYSTDVNGILTYANDTTFNILGINKQINLDLTEFIHSDFKETVKEQYRQQFLTRTTSSYYEFPIINEQNKLIWLGQSTQLHLKENWVIGYQCVARNITERKKAETEKENLLQEISERELKINAIIENTQDGIWAIDNMGRVTVYNDPIKSAWPIFTGHEISIGYNWLHFLAETQDLPTSIEWLKNIRRVLKGESFKIEQNYEIQQRTFFTEITINPILTNTGEIAGAIFITHDITSHKEEEQDLKLAKTVAEASMKAKEQFLSVMSHEIRTPMNAILGMSHLLAQENLSVAQNELLHGIRYSAENLLVIINDILDFSKIEAGGMTFENIDFDLYKTITATINSLSIAAANKSLPLNYQIAEHTPLYLKGDPTRLNQILTNLIGNAIKFTESGMVNLNVRLLTTFNDKNILRFDITDTGIGIPADKLSSIFDSFTQADAATTRKFGGTGLGLSITKKLIEMQGGKLTVTSSEGTGSVFSFEIAYETGQETQTSYNPNLAAIKFEQLRVLLVEDNKMNQLVATKLMEGWNVSVMVAESGQEAIEITTKNSFDIILMDLQMPGMDGFEATRMIRNNKLAYDTPIIALTASVTGDVQKKCKDAGMNDYVSKPIDPTTLNLKLAEYNIQKGKTTPEQSVIDMAYLEEAAGGSKDFIISMINIFLKQTPEFLEQLNQAYHAEDWSKIKALAHKIKPTYGSFGISKLKTTFERLEWVAANNNSQDEMAEIIKQIEQTSSIAYIELSQKLNEL